MFPMYLSYEVTRPPRWDRFGAGIAINTATVLLLVVLGPRLAREVPLQIVDTSTSVPLIAPAPVHAARVAPPPPKVIQPKPQVLAKLAPPKMPALPVEQVKTPEPPKVEPPKPESKPEPAFASAAPAGPPKPSHPVDVKTNVFGSAGSETATLKKPPREVQTGGFGNPNGIAGTGDPKRNTVTVANVGSFDLPQGEGVGNGTGGRHGASGTIRSAGFSDGVASTGTHGRGNGGGVVQGGFGDAVAANNGAPHRAEAKPQVDPVEILFKPRPNYTDEARRMRVQGEVLIDVVFEANGTLHINRVVRGLGHGLDEAALAAAQRIRFRPARRDGQPYDSAALVHIVFELAD